MLIMKYFQAQKKTRKFKFTYKDISRATGLSEGTLRVYVHKGKFVPSNLESLVTFIFPRLKS